MTIPEDHIRACPEHRVVVESSDDCPCCATGVEARPEAYDGEVKQTDIRWHIEPDTMKEVLRLMEPYLDDNDQGPMWVTVAELPKRQLPAGYTVQERWFNVIQYEWGSKVKTMVHESDAKETIETLRENGYETESEVDAD